MWVLAHACVLSSQICEFRLSHLTNVKNCSLAYRHACWQLCLHRNLNREQPGLAIWIRKCRIVSFSFLNDWQVMKFSSFTMLLSVKSRFQLNLQVHIRVANPDIWMCMPIPKQRNYLLYSSSMYSVHCLLSFLLNLAHNTAANLSSTYLNRQLRKTGKSEWTIIGTIIADHSAFLLLSTVS